MKRDYTPIDCGLHDHLELACLRHYRLRIVTRGGELRGVAVTTRTEADRTEWLLLEGNGAPRRVRLDDILAIEALDEAADFGFVDFTTADGRPAGTP